MGQVAWTLDHQRDLLADFRAIYHLAPREVAGLSGPEYMALAYRLPAYQGVMAMRVQQEEERSRKNLRHRDAKLVDSSKASIQADPLLRDVVDM